jgi:hypothetical protein
VLVPGPICRAAFPERGEPVALAEIASLVNFGFPQAVIDAWAGAQLFGGKGNLRQPIKEVQNPQFCSAPQGRVFGRARDWNDGTA